MEKANTPLGYLPLDLIQDLLIRDFLVRGPVDEYNQQYNGLTIVGKNWSNSQNGLANKMFDARKTFTSQQKSFDTEMVIRLAIFGEYKGVKLDRSTQPQGKELKKF